MKEFDQSYWDQKLMAAKDQAEWKKINADMEKAWADYDKQVAKDAEENPWKYETHQDSNGRFYTLDKDGNRVYREMKTCEICGERNEAGHESWWKAHEAEHEHKRQFDLKHDPLILKIQKWADEHWYGKKHQERWMRVLMALGVVKHGHLGFESMSIEEAEKMYRRYSKRRWGPVLERMKQG